MTELASSCDRVSK